MKKTGHTQIFLRILVGVTLCKVDANKIFSSVCFMNPLWRVPYSNHGLSVTKVQCPHLQNRNLSQGTGRIIVTCIEILFERLLVWKLLLFPWSYMEMLYDHPYPWARPPHSTIPTSIDSIPEPGLSGSHCPEGPKDLTYWPEILFYTLINGIRKQPSKLTPTTWHWGNFSG